MSLKSSIRWGSHARQVSKLAPRRYDSLAGRRIGLLDNNKPNADKFLQFIGELLQARHAEIELVAKRKMTRMESDGLAQLAGGLRCRHQRLCRLRLVHVVECPRLGETRKRGDCHGDGGEQRVLGPGSGRGAVAWCERSAAGQSAASGGHDIA